MGYPAWARRKLNEAEAQVDVRMEKLLAEAQARVKREEAEVRKHPKES